jgi:F-type H+-transporting ATPase subunit gamma
MATLKQIRSRIRTAKNIQQITRAMKLVAAARLRKATDRVFEARSYSEKLRELMLSLSSAGELPQHPLMDKRPVNNILLIVLSADRGLAGSYNTNITRRAGDFIKAQTVPVKLFGVGKKTAGFHGRRGVPVIEVMPVQGTGARLEDAHHIREVAERMYTAGEVDAVYILYSKFYSPIRQVPQVVQLLPIEPPEKVEGAEAIAETNYTFEPNAAELLGTLLPRYFLTLIWQALLEATASEHGARMSAMTSATENAGKMIQTLTLKANRERQATITTQILEVVSGAEALKA